MIKGILTNRIECNGLVWLYDGIYYWITTVLPSTPTTSVYFLGHVTIWRIHMVDINQ